ncbi:HAD-like protein [Sporormia fimetaria CBS 119925]|uniref:Mitochondrial import inner membrane translocase subunit TIM50 n=1 Tax=Sporormia fimetaria CBS 119925 TaxID=1340428 RepID=A0A6A6V1R1_9PLEO|nr:HAD-like protein [Sporormia fimetaria CBS 119925]
MLPAPMPTEEYLAAAQQPYHTIDPPNRFLIVLDLNGTLIYRPNRKQPTKLIARPFLKPFLRFLFENFSVMIWSSAKPENVRVIVDRVLDEELRSKLTARWARDSFGLRSEHYNQNVQVYKDLSKIWNDEEIQQQHPSYQQGGRFGQHTTILLDDTRLKANAQPHNLVEIPEFEATDEQMHSDILREVAGYLQQARMQDNVSSFIRENDFVADGRWQYDWPDEMAGGVEVGEQAHLRE